MTEIIVLLSAVYLTIGVVIDIVIQLIVHDGRPVLSHVGVITLWPVVLFELLWGL